MKILYHGDSKNIATGYGLISKLLLENLVEIDPSLEISMISKNEPVREKVEINNLKIYPVGHDSVEKLLGFQKLADIVKGDDPEISGEFDVYIYNGDFIHFDYVQVNGMSAVKFFRETFNVFKKKIIYTAIDNETIYPEWLKIFDLFDDIVVPSGFGRKVLVRANPKLESKIKVIPYGLDVENFNIEKIKKLRSPKLKNKFVVGYVGKNQWRKDLGLLIQSFCIFKKNTPNAFLYLHTSQNDEDNFFGDLKKLLDYKGLKENEDYQISFKKQYLRGIDRKNVPAIYANFDVYLSTSVGEGYGLPIAEAMLSGVPVVAMLNSAIEELIIDSKDSRGFGYNPYLDRVFGWYDFMRVRSIGEPFEVSSRLKSVFMDSHYKNEYKKIVIKNAREFMEKRTAKKMAEDFYKLLPTKKEIEAKQGKKKMADFYFPTMLHYHFDGYARLVRYLNENLAPEKDCKYRLNFGGVPQIEKTPGVKNLLFTMFEADRIPDRWARDCKKYYDGLILPSDFAIQVFKNAGVKLPMVKVPLFASDFRIFNPDDKVFVFGHQNSLVEGGQKGWDLVIRAFLHLFYGRPDVKLILKAREHHWANSEWYARELKKQPNIEIITEDFTDQEMNDKFYARLNCFVYPSRGEGWGLPPTEAIAHGIPTILTKAHSHLEFSKYGIEIGTVGRAFPFYHRRTNDMGIGYWVEPSIEELEAAMMDVLKLYPGYKKEALAKQKEFEKIFNGQNFINNLIRAIHSF